MGRWARLSTGPGGELPENRHLLNRHLLDSRSAAGDPQIHLKRRGAIKPWLSRRKTAWRFIFLKRTNPLNTAKAA